MSLPYDIVPSFQVRLNWEDDIAIMKNIYFEMSFCSYTQFRKPKVFVA